MSSIASHAPGEPGPWTVKLIGKDWYIVHPTKRTRRIGPAQTTGKNHYDAACREAERRNKEAK